MGYWSRQWAPYVPVARRRRNAAAEAKRLLTNGQELAPVVITGKAIVSSFWGKAWCDNLTAYSDFSNRLPRGRTYARNGSVVDLRIQNGLVTALVSGSSLYRVEITIAKLASERWKTVCITCAGSIGTLLDLMRGKLSEEVIQHITNPRQGMFPSPKEIRLSCSCPDYASMCKHVAATLYGVGNRLDSAPELFFLLRGVDQRDLISTAVIRQRDDDVMGLNSEATLERDELGSMFGIELAMTPVNGAAKETERIRKSIRVVRIDSESKGGSESTSKPTKKRVANKVVATTAKKVVKKATKIKKAVKGKRKAEFPPVTKPAKSKAKTSAKAAVKKVSGRKTVRKKT